MGEVSNDFLAEMLRRIQSDLIDLKADSRENRMRMGSMETQLGQLHMQVAQLHVQYAEISTRMDRRDEVMERVLRRLDLSEAS